MEKKFDWKNIFFIVPFILLISISLLLMYHAGFISNLYQNHFEKQLLWFGVGFLLIIFFHFFPIQYLFKYSLFFYIFNVLLLILVLFIGKNINGAKAWIDLKYFSFQPSEFMKISYSLYLAYLCSKKKFFCWKDEIKFLLYVLLLFIIPAILVFMGPDTGAILFYFFITLVLLWNSRIHKRWFVIFGILVVSFISVFFYLYFWQKDLLISLIGTTFFYRMDRLFSLGSGMQIENALIAIGSAPFWRFSLTQTGIYIPEAPTDFAFALTSNVLGITGNILILVAFLFLDFYFITYAKKIKKKEYRFFLFAFLTIFILSQIINISMNIGIFPIIGIPLPFISYGGSSTIVLFIFLGIIFQSTKKKIK